MEALVQQGLVRSIGMSNFSRKKLEGLLAEGVSIKPAVLQVIACLHT
jgi:diketogulonate reductase-like aldo/keto reductase